MKNRIHRNILLTFVLLGVFIGGASTLYGDTGQAARLLKRADNYRRILYGSAKKKRYRQYWMRCARDYERVYKRHPKSNEAPWALFKEAELYRHLFKYSGWSRDLDKSIELFREVSQTYKTSRLADDAQFRIGEIYYHEKKDMPQAYVEFLKVDIQYPSGDMRPRARVMLNKLAALLGKKEDARQAKNNEKDTSGPALVKDIRHWSTRNYTRVVVDLEKPVKYQHHLLKEDSSHGRPGRFYLDLSNARVSKEIDNSIPIKGDLLQRVRAGQYQKNKVRVVLDIDSPGTFSVFHLYDPFRIVVDVRKKETPKKIKKPLLALEKQHVRRGVRKSRVSDKSISLARQLGLNVKRIVIDPGHGGKDPGCYCGRIMEKNITLELAKELAAKIRKEIGCKVYLTRTTDVFIPLERRTAIANMKKADLFISLHVNANRDRKVHGVETYFLNMATDRNAVMVAARENAVSEKSISDLQGILNDLMLNTKIHESSRLAHDVENDIVSELDGRYKSVDDLGVKQAPFYVLIGAEMPSILVETGFLTNPMERRRLISRIYQEKVAQGICDGVERYIRGINQVYQGG